MSRGVLRSIIAIGVAIASMAPLAVAAPTELAITIDDLPTSPASIQAIIDTLQSHSVPEVYGFFNGIGVGEGDSAVPLLAATRAWVAAGYPLGNHTFSHLDINAVSTEDFIQDIAANEIPLRDLSQGMHYHLFRYPMLHEGDTTEKRNAVRAYLVANGYTFAPVSLDFQDWAWTEADLRCRRMGDDASLSRMDDLFIIHALSRLAHARHQARRIYERDIRFVTLLHATAFQARVLPRLLDSLGTLEDGVSYVSTTRALHDGAYRQDHGIAREGGATWLDLHEFSKFGVVELGPQPPSEIGRMCRAH